MRVVAGVCALALLTSCGGGSGTSSVAPRPRRTSSPRTAELLAVADLGVLRGHCPSDGPARLVYMDRSGTGIDVRARVGDRRPVHEVPSPSSDRFRTLAPRNGAEFVPVHLVISTTREPEEILATVDLRLTSAPTPTHPSGCGLGHVRVDVATRSHWR